MAQTHGVFDVDYVTKELDLLNPKKIKLDFYKVDLKIKMYLRKCS